MVVLVLGALVLFALAPAVARADNVILANGEWAPYMSEKRKHFGVVSHIIKRAFAEEEVAIDYMFLPWKRGYEMAKKGDLEGTIVWSYTNERAKDFLYSDEVIFLETAIFYNKGTEFDWSTFEDLQGKKIGGIIGFAYNIDNLEKSGVVTIDRIAEPESNFKMLVNNRVDLVAEDLFVGREIIAKLSLADEISIHEKPMNRKSFHLIVGKKVAGAKVIITTFNQGLEKLKASGQYQQMINNVNDYRSDPD